MKNTPVISTPICNFLRDYAGSGISRFHMPGHKGMPSGRTAEECGLSWHNDITEVHGADSLYEASGIIMESEKNASLLFGSAATFYSTEGSSQCIRAMLALATQYQSGLVSDRKCPSDPSGKSAQENASVMHPIILAARNVHRAFITACALLDLDVEWLLPENADYSLCSCMISKDQVRRKLANMAVKPAALYLTSPDYLGNIQDIRGISEIAHEYGVPLLVDNAHGAYLHFLENPIHPLDLGADMCCDSAHKTLPALTGCAYLHISENAPASYIENAKLAMAMFGSTSPSYLLLSSLDNTNLILNMTWKAALAECINRINECKKMISDTGWDVYGWNGNQDGYGRPADQGFFEPMKITINCTGSGISGTGLAGLLREHGIECEYCDPDYLVLMPSPSNTIQDFEKLKNAVKTISATISRQPDSEAKTGITAFRLPENTRRISIRQAAFSARVLLPVEKAIGRICADTAITCPPAIPLAVCGEMIAEDFLPVFRHYGITHISVCL